MSENARQQSAKRPIATSSGVFEVEGSRPANARANAQAASLQGALRAVPGCLALGVMELRRGRLTSVCTAGDLDDIDTIACATGELFLGADSSVIEQLFERLRGPRDLERHVIEEIIVVSRGRVYLLVRARSDEERALVFVCDATSNLGLILARARLQLPSLDAA